MGIRSQAFIYFDRKKHFQFQEILEMANYVELITQQNLPDIVAIRCQNRITFEKIVIEDKIVLALILPYPGYLYYSDVELAVAISHEFRSFTFDHKKDNTKPAQFIKEKFPLEYSDAMMVSEYFSVGHKKLIKKMKNGTEVLHLHTQEIFKSKDLEVELTIATAAVCAFIVSIPITAENKEMVARRLNVRKTNSIASSIKLINLHKFLDNEVLDTEDEYRTFPIANLKIEEFSNATRLIKSLNSSFEFSKLRYIGAIELSTEPTFDWWEGSAELILVVPWPYIEGIKTWEFLLKAEYYQLFSKFSVNKNDQLKLVYNELIKKYSVEKIIFSRARTHHHCEISLEIESCLKSAQSQLSAAEFKKVIFGIIENIKKPISEKHIQTATKEIFEIFSTSGVIASLNNVNLSKVVKDNMYVEENIFTNLPEYHSLTEQITRSYLAKINEYISFNYSKLNA